MIFPYTEGSSPEPLNVHFGRLLSAPGAVIDDRNEGAHQLIDTPGGVFNE